MKFSDKLGITKPKSIIQINEMDNSLRNKLWNVIYIYLVLPLNKEEWDALAHTKFHNFFIGLWHNYFEKPIDTIPSNKQRACDSLREYFFKCQWFEAYNLIDFIYNNSVPIDKDAFQETLNSILESELAGYKYVGNELIPITEESEVKEIEDSLFNTNSYKMKGVKLHLESALRILSNKKNPDYRNVIKESISAVESISQILTGDKKAELGKALGILRDKINIHRALEQGFKKIYGYTSDADGIRHALLEKDNLDVEDAKYMLVSCSAFINYLIIKADKAGIIEK